MAGILGLWGRESHRISGDVKRRLIKLSQCCSLLKAVLAQSTQNPCWILCGTCTAQGIAGPCVWQGEKSGGISGSESPLGLFGFQQKLYTWLHRHISLPWWMYKLYISINLLLGALRFPLMTCVPLEPGKAKFHTEMLRTSQHLPWLMASRRSWGWILTVQGSWQVTGSVAPPVQPQVQILPVQHPRKTHLPVVKSSWCDRALALLKNGSHTWTLVYEFWVLTLNIYIRNPSEEKKKIPGKT